MSVHVSVVKDSYERWNGEIAYRNIVKVGDEEVWDIEYTTEGMAMLVSAMESIDPDADYPVVGGEGATETGAWILDFMEETAGEMAEHLEVYFIYQRNGKERQYTPVAFWEPSGSCEWEQSATEYDYGWDI